MCHHCVLGRYSRCALCNSSGGGKGESKTASLRPNRLAAQQDLVHDILAWEGALAPEETAARDAVRAWVAARFMPRITEARL
jgi:hypothetical protein